MVLEKDFGHIMWHRMRSYGLRHEHHCRPCAFTRSLSTKNRRRINKLETSLTSSYKDGAKPASKCQNCRRIIGLLVLGQGAKGRDASTFHGPFLVRPSELTSRALAGSRGDGGLSVGRKPCQIRNGKRVSIVLNA